MKLKDCFGFVIKSGQTRMTPKNLGISLINIDIYTNQSQLVIKSGINIKLQ
jgi:hypothetical protein